MLIEANGKKYILHTDIYGEVYLVQEIYPENKFIYELNDDIPEEIKNYVS